MTRNSLVLVHRVLIVLVVLLVPAAAPSQEQNQPTATQLQEKPAEAAASEQGSLALPTTAEKASSASEQAETESAQSKEKDGRYIIKQGDTLWDISHMFLKDPFLWPFIWKANTYIHNPDLIFPGNALVIPNLAPIERALAPAETGQPENEVSSGVLPVSKRQTEPEPAASEEEVNTSRLILPDEEPVPIMDKYSMLNAGFINLYESKDVIVGSKEGKTIVGYDDIVYVSIRSKENAEIGDKFVIYTPMNKVRHPVNGRNFGRLIKVLGILELIEKGSKSSTFTARITLSFDAAEKGSMLTPYQEPTLIYNQAQTKTKDIVGYILEVVDTRTINAQTDIVYLDKGSAEGVDPGDRFVVYSRSRKGPFPKTKIGEAQVFLVKEHTSTAVVRKSTSPLAKGDEVESKK